MKNINGESVLLLLLLLFTYEIDEKASISSSQDFNNVKLKVLLQVLVTLEILGV